MGPSLLFDKSAIQSLGQQSLSEVNRYFYTTVPPVLLMEILADLSLAPNDLETSRAKVRELAHKVLPSDSMSTVHYQCLCTHNLLGEYIPMDHRPVVFPGKPVVAKDGTKGVFIDVQPEEEAVLRWQSGLFNEEDVMFAIQWRENAKGTNLEELRNAVLKPPFRIRSLEYVDRFVDIMLAEPEFQEPLLCWLLGFLRCDQPTSSRVCSRWRSDIHRSLKAFAPFAVHCLRVQLVFYIGMTHGILSTRPSNIVDLEYLCYTPFAFAFCSGDKLHRQLAPFILDADQSFVERQEMQDSLTKIVAARKIKADSEPGEDSLIYRLWMKHWGKPPHQAMQRPISEEESKQIMERMKPILEALQEQKRKQGPRFPV